MPLKPPDMDCWGTILIYNSLDQSCNLGGRHLCEMLTEKRRGDSIAMTGVTIFAGSFSIQVRRDIYRYPDLPC